MIYLYNKILKEKEKKEEKYKITLTLRNFIDSIASTNRTSDKIKISIEIFHYLCINKWFIKIHKNFSDTVRSKLLQFIIDDLIYDSKNRNLMIIFYLLLFHIESISNNKLINYSTKTVKTYYEETKFNTYSNNNLDYYLDNL